MINSDPTCGRVLFAYVTELLRQSLELFEVEDKIILQINGFFI